MIRRVEDMTRYPDAEGKTWYALHEVCELLKTIDTGKVTRHIYHGRRKTMMECGRDWRFRKIWHYIDGVALIEVCIAKSRIPSRDVRAFVRGNDGAAGGAVTRRRATARN